MKKLAAIFLSLIFFLAFNSVFTISSSKLNTNNISTWFRNNGSFNRNPVTGDSGFEWPIGTSHFARYASGIWIGYRNGTDTSTVVSEYVYDYNPGFIDNNGNPQGGNDSTYRIYNIYRNDTTNYDYTHWPVNQGAYTKLSKPHLLGTQTMFYTYHDGYGHTSNIENPQPLKVQILQTNWGYDTSSVIGNVIFSDYRVINRSNIVWDNMYFSFWTDDDLGIAVDDAIGCDTLRNLGYTYNATNNDPSYGLAPPAVGTFFLRGLQKYTGNNNDTVKYFSPPGTNNFIKKIGYKQLGMTVHNHYINGNPQPTDPRTTGEIYKVISGKWRTGQSWINPVSGDTTVFTFSGDPVSGNGWIMTNGGNRRNLISTGPVSMNPNDTQSVIIAQVIAKGSSNLNSITKLKELVDKVKIIYDNNFSSLVSINNNSSFVPERDYLFQNYPNPFNPSTFIKFNILKTGKVKLVIYDILGKEVSILKNEIMNKGEYQVSWDASGYPGGVYFYKLNVNSASIIKKMVLLK